MEEYFLLILIIKALSLTLGLLMIFWILWLIARVFTRNYSHLFGYNLQIRVLALGGTSIVFKDTIYNLIYGVLNFVKGLISASVQTFFNDGSDGHEVEQMLIDFGYLFKRIIDELDTLFSYLDFGAIFLCLAFWVFLGQLISTFISKEEATNMHPYFTGVKSHVKQNLMLVFVLMLSVYFIVSAIASLPAMRDNEKVSDVTPAKLQASMVEFEKQYADSAIFITNDLSKLEVNTAPDEWFSKIQFVPNNSSGISQLQQTKNAYENLYNNYHSVINEYMNRHIELVGTLQKAKKVARIQTITALDKCLAKSNNSEKSQYLPELINWYGGELTNIADNMDRSKNQLISMTSQYNFILTRRRDDILQTANELNSILYNSSLKSENTKDSITRVHFENLSRSQYLPEFDEEFPMYYPTKIPCPEPAKPGSGLGPFSFFTSWLMETRSIQLVLIIGMFGFGIFGASISSIIKKHIQDTRALKQTDPNKIYNPSILEEKPKPYVEDLGTLVIRGVSATLVVFLAVQGGLVILSSDGSITPNPYALFLICMIGAVFSEQVWEWAKDKIADTMPDDSNKK